MDNFYSRAHRICLAQERPKITGVAHIALFVKDVEKARTFYKGLLGYEEPFSLKNPMARFH